MENQTHSTQTDIAEQTYQGPGPVITSLGYGVIDYKIASVASAALGAAIALIYPKQTEHAFEQFARSSKQWHESTNVAKRVTGRLGITLDNLGHWFENNVPFKTKLQSLFEKSPEKWKPVSRLTGLFAMVGFFATFFTAAGRGIASANRGKHQFEAAQAEIRTLRKQLAESQQEANKKEHALTPTDQTAESVTHTKVMQQPDVNDTPRTEVQAQSAMREPLQQPEAVTSKTL